MNILIRKFRFLIIFILILPALLPVFHGGFFPTQDSVHVPRVYEMDQSLFDGQFPVRWVSQVRYGEPTFNFYAPFPYYVGSLIHHFGFDYIGSVKILIAIGFLASAFGMYLLVSEIYGVYSGITAAIFYTYAPYHSVDSYVRGALPESWALIFFPLIFWAVIKLSKEQNIKNLSYLTLTIVGLLLTHNIMSLLFAPFAAFWVLVILYKSKKKNFLFYLIFSVLLGVGLSAFFWAPAFFEKDLVQNQYLTKGYFDFRGHFVAIFQFFKPVWGYGASVFGSEDELSFQIGLAHWLLIGLSLAALLIGLIKKRELVNKARGLVVIFALIALSISLFMQHNQSIYIWDTFPTLAFVQFPWRFLGISIFFASIIAGFFVSCIHKYELIICCLAIVLVISLNIGYFHPQRYQQLTDQDYISHQILADKDATPKDYMPVWVKDITTATMTEPVVLQGDAKIKNFDKKSSKVSFDIEASSSSQIKVPVYYFPNWTVFLDTVSSNLDKIGDDGLIVFTILPGSHHVDLVLQDTAIRSYANLVSLVCLVIMLSLLFSKKILRR